MRKFIVNRQETDEDASGYALRVPKIVRFRHDKKVEELDDMGKCENYTRCNMKGMCNKQYEELE